MMTINTQLDAREPVSMDDLDTELCKYCPCTDYGLVQANTGPYSLCEGISCNEAYENYLSEFNKEDGCND